MKKNFFIAFLTMTQLWGMAQTSGSLDASFGTNGKVVTSMSSNMNDVSFDIVVQSDGKILAGGGSFDPNGILDASVQVARYNSNGTLDNTFGTNGKVNTKIATKSLYGNNIALQPDGKIIVSGRYQSGVLLIRYNTNGTLDNSFDGDGIATLETPNESYNIFALALQSDGKIVVAGESFAGSTGSNARTTLFRYNSNGSIDATFNTTGRVVTDVDSILPDRVFDIAIQNDGKILVCGHILGSLPPNYTTTVISAILLRYNANGTLDATFGTNGIIIQKDADARSVKILNNGKILTSGTISEANNTNSFNGIFRYNSNGVLDNTFGTNGIIKSNSGTGTTSMVLQTDSKILLAGTSYNTTTQDNGDLVLSRHNANGTLDNTFGTNGVSTTKFVVSTSSPKMILQNDNKILVCNGFKDIGKTNFAIFRFNNTVGTGVNSIATEEKITIYPNPVKNDVTIRLDDIDVEKLNLKITDALGRIVVERNYVALLKGQNTVIRLDNLSSGLYFIHFSGDNLHQTQSFVKF